MFCCATKRNQGQATKKFVIFRKQAGMKSPLSWFQLAGTRNRTFPSEIRAASSKKFLERCFRSKTMEHDHFMAGFVATNQFHPAPGTTQPTGQQFQQSFVGRRIHRRSGDFDS